MPWIWRGFTKHKSRCENLKKIMYSLKKNHHHHRIQHESDLSHFVYPVNTVDILIRFFLPFYLKWTFALGKLGSSTTWFSKRLLRYFPCVQESYIFSCNSRSIGVGEDSCGTGWELEHLLPTCKTDMYNVKTRTTKSCRMFSV